MTSGRNRVRWPARLTLSGAALAGVALAWVFTRDPAPGQQEALVPPSASTSAIEAEGGQMTATDAETYAAALDSRFPDAPDEVRALAAGIMAGDVPTAETLAALPPEFLNAGFSRPYPDARPAYVHTLLREAVVSENPAAAEALAAAGANPFFNNHEMPQLGMRIITGNRNLAFPDYSQGNRFVVLWLAAGGDPNMRLPDEATLPLLLNKLPNLNLEGAMILLRAGADPWLSVQKRILSDGSEVRSRSFIEMYANAHPASCEMIFRLAHAGLIGPGPADAMERVSRLYAIVAGNYVDGTGPAATRASWNIQMALEALIAATGLVPTGDAARLLHTPVTERAAKIGDGFWLGPDETHSRDVETQLVTSERQYGTETWQ